MVAGTRRDLRRDCLAIAPLRDFFDLVILSAGQWFLALLAVAAGLVLAAVAWRIPYIQHLEAPGLQPASDVPAPTHSPHTTDMPAIAPRTPAEPPRARAPTARDGGVEAMAEQRRRTKIVATVGPALAPREPDRAR